MKTPEPDPKWEALTEHYENILYLYRQYADKRPVMLLDIQEQRIYAYPCREFAADLSSRSQASLAAQYAEAVANGQMVVFVRDNLKRQLISYSVPCEQTSEAGGSREPAPLPRRTKLTSRSAAGTRAPRPKARKRKS